MALFSRQHGLVRGVAKGSKREKGAFSGGFEVPSFGEISMSTKATEGLTLLTAWDLQRTYPAVRSNLSAFYASMCVVDTVYQAVIQNDPHPTLFDGLATGLDRLSDEPSNRRAVLDVLWTVLNETGHRPELHTDVRSGESLVDASTFGFSSRLGGLLPDAPNVTHDGEGGTVWRVRAKTVKLLRSLGESRALLASEADNDTVSRAIKLLGLHYREIFRVEPVGLNEVLNVDGKSDAKSRK